MSTSEEQDELLKMMVTKMAQIEIRYFEFLTSDKEDARWTIWFELNKSDRAEMLAQARRMRVMHQGIIADLDIIIDMFKRYKQLGEEHGSTREEIIRAHDIVFTSWHELHAQTKQVLDKIDQRYSLVFLQHDRGKQGE